MASTLNQLKGVAVTVVVADNTPQAVYDAMFQNIFNHRSKSRNILENCVVDSKQPLSSSCCLITYKCDFNMRVLLKNWIDFFDFFCVACVRFCQISRKSNLKLWLSTDFRQAYAPLPEASYANFGLKLSSFSLGAMEDRFTFIDHFSFHDQSFTTSASTVDFEHDSKILTVHFNMQHNQHRETKYEMQLRYDEVDSSILIDESSPICCVYFMLNIPPCFYRIKRFPNGFQQRYRVISAGRLTTDIIGNSSVLALMIAKYDHYYDNLDVISRLQASGKTIQRTYVNVKHQHEGFDENIEELFEDNFGMQYSFECLLSRGFVVTDRATDLFDSLSTISPSHYVEAERALHRLALQVEKDRFIDLGQQFRKNLKESKKLHELDANDFHNCRFVRRAIVTPTRCILLHPELTFQNRILRHCGEEHCLRVVFRDENFNKLRCYEAAQAEEISNRVQDVLDSGIQIGQRHYELLACSNSQLRDHACWLYAEDQDGQTAEDIREWMGDFSQIKSVPKYIARMGQCFSKSEESVNVSAEGVYVEKEDDIKSSDGKYCFSDGIGKVSGSLASKMATALGEVTIPSAFQIRFRGCKGVVAIDPTLTGDTIVIRKSMEKFQSTHDEIEVITTSQPSPLYLNRQAITLLSGLGVENEAFLGLQEKMLFQIGQMLLNDKQAAKSLTSHKSRGTNINFDHALEAGMSLTTEPFLRGLLQEVYNNSIYELQRKARIEIPSSYGRNMIGVLDETGKLRYGEVFVQYSTDLENPQEEPIVHSDMVVVSKFPALHPGDMRKFKAVDIPDLYHMVDCIVFPQRGKRPHPDEMAGSDLDGDMYFVTWLPALIFKRRNVTPMNFEFDIPQTTFHTGLIDTSDMSQYIAEYIKNDKLGPIANAHLAQADKNGIFSDVCVEIAEIHAQAVDFAKTGYAPDLNRGHRPYIYPDFMGKTDKCTYKSQNVLGVLFRQCREINRMVAQSRDIGYGNVAPDNFFIYPGWNSFEDSARRTLHNYNRRLEDILLQYGVEKESEALSGCIRKLNKHLTQSNEIYDAKLLISIGVKSLLKGTRRNFFHEFGGEDTVINYTDEILAKASAWYNVTYNQQIATYLSFPWAVSDILFEVRKRCLSKKRSRAKTTRNMMEHLSFEAEQYRRNGSEKIIRDLISVGIPNPLIKARLLRIIPKYLQDNPFIQPVVGFLLKWHQNKELRVKRMHLVIILLSLAMEGVKPSEQQIDAKIAINNAGELLIKFLTYCASCQFKQATRSIVLHKWKLDMQIQKEERSELSKAAELAYHQLSLHGTLQTAIGSPNDISKTEINEKTIKVNRAAYDLREQLTETLQETHPEVSISFRLVNESSKKSDANVTISGPIVEVNAVHDLLVEWTDNIPPEFFI